MNTVIRTHQDYLLEKRLIDEKLFRQSPTQNDIVKTCFAEYELTNKILQPTGISIPFDCFNRLSFRELQFKFHHSYYGKGLVVANCYQAARLDFYRTITGNFDKRFFSPLLDKFFTKIEITIF